MPLNDLPKKFTDCRARIYIININNVVIHLINAYERSSLLTMANGYRIVD